MTNLSTPWRLQTKSDRLDLGVALCSVSGDRALKNAETFEKTLDLLADALGVVVDASHAAVVMLGTRTTHCKSARPLKSSLQNCVSLWASRVLSSIL